MNRLKNSACMLAAGLLIGSFGVAPSGADELARWDGTITLPDLVFSHERPLYAQEGCEVDHPDASTYALIDLRDHQGSLLRFTGGAGDLSGAQSVDWWITKGVSCDELGPTGETSVAGAQMEWVNSSPFVGIYFTTVEYNLSYTLQVISQ